MGEGEVLKERKLKSEVMLVRQFKATLQAMLPPKLLFVNNSYLLLPILLSILLPILRLMLLFLLLYLFESGMHVEPNMVYYNWYQDIWLDPTQWDDIIHAQNGGKTIGLDAHGFEGRVH